MLVQTYNSMIQGIPRSLNVLPGKMKCYTCYERCYVSLPILFIQSHHGYCLMAAGKWRSIIQQCKKNNIFFCLAKLFRLPRILFIKPANPYVLNMTRTHLETIQQLKNTHVSQAFFIYIQATRRRSWSSLPKKGFQGHLIESMQYCQHKEPDSEFLYPLIEESTY